MNRCPHCGKVIGHFPDKDGKGNPAIGPVCPNRKVKR